MPETMNTHYLGEIRLKFYINDLGLIMVDQDQRLDDSINTAMRDLTVGERRTLAGFRGNIAEAARQFLRLLVAPSGRFELRLLAHGLENRAPAGGHDDGKPDSANHVANRPLHF